MRLTAAAACHLGGNGERLEQEVAAITADAGCPSPLREIAVCWRQMLAANHGGSISDAVDMLHDLAIGQLRLGLKYFAGITLHNTANAELARGNYQIAVQLAKDAVEQLEQTDEGAAVVTSSQSVAAVAIAESGGLSEGLRAALSAATDPYATADAIAEAAYLSAITGRSARAETLLAKFDKGDAPWSKELPSRAQAAYARVALRLCEGDTTGAGEPADGGGHSTADIDGVSRAAVMDATLAYLEGAADALERAQTAVALATTQCAWRWLTRARILRSVAERDGAKLHLWITEAERDSALALLDLADVGSRLPLAC